MYEGMYLDIREAIHDKPTVNILPNGEKLKVFYLRSGLRQRRPLLPYQHSTESISQSI